MLLRTHATPMLSAIYPYHHNNHVQEETPQLEITAKERNTDRQQLPETNHFSHSE